MNKTVNRYSDAELEEFRQLIENKMAKARKDLEDLVDQILEITENSGDDFGIDWMDDSSTSADLDMLNDMAIRQRKYIKDLENALVRIKNKIYGICVITGELIDKKRLMAVPTTTKSLAAKVEEQNRPQPLIADTSLSDEQEEEETEEKAAKQKEPKIITKIIRKPNPNKPVVRDLETDLDLDIDDEVFEDNDDDYVDLDTIPDEESEDFEI